MNGMCEFYGKLRSVVEKMHSLILGNTTSAYNWYILACGNFGKLILDEGVSGNLGSEYHGLLRYGVENMHRLSLRNPTSPL